MELSRPIYVERIASPCGSSEPGVDNGAYSLSLKKSLVGPKPLRGFFFAVPGRRGLLCRGCPLIPGKPAGGVPRHRSIEGTWPPGASGLTLTLMPDLPAPRHRPDSISP